MMDADSSYGGSDTAQDSTLGQDPNSSLESSPMHQPATSLPSSTGVDNHYYHKNEIHLNVNYDETDRHQASEDSAVPRLPHYKSTANLNVNADDDEHSAKYNSSSHLNGSSIPSNQNGQIGVDNPAFQEDEMKLNGNLNLTMTSPSKKDEQMAEAVNLELINLKPNGKDVTGPYENGMKTIPLKREPVGEMPSAYDEYFVPVNEHRKYMSSSRSGKAKNCVTFGVNPQNRSDNVDKSSGLDESGLSLTKPEHGVLDYPEWLKAMHQQRGEKLYITKDKRIKTNRNKRICWSIAIAIIAAVIVGGILIGAGIISDDQTSYESKESARRFSENRKPDTAGGLFGSNSIDDPPLPYTPGMPTSTLPTNIATDTTMIQVPNALESQFVIDNMQFAPELGFANSSEFQELARDLEKRIKDTLGVDVKVVEFTPGSVVVRYRIVWRHEDDDLHHQQQQQVEINEQFVRTKFAQMLREGHGHMGKYRISNESIVYNRILDLCKIDNNGCQDKCIFDYDQVDFQCQCAEGRILSVDGKKCNDLIDEDFNFNHLYSSDHEPVAEPEPEPITEFVADFGSSDSSTEFELVANPEPSVEPEPAAEPKPDTITQQLFVESEPASEPEPSVSPEPTAEPKLTTEPSEKTDIVVKSETTMGMVPSSTPEPDMSEKLSTTKSETVTDAIIATKSDVSSESNAIQEKVVPSTESATNAEPETIVPVDISVQQITTSEPETSSRLTMEQSPRKSKFNDDVQSMDSLSVTTPETAPQTTLTTDSSMLESSHSGTTTHSTSMAEPTQQLTTQGSNSIVEDMAKNAKLEEANSTQLKIEAIKAENEAISTQGPITITEESTTTMKTVKSTTNPVDIQTSQSGTVSPMNQFVMETTTTSDTDMMTTTEVPDPVMNVEVSINTYLPETHQSIAAIEPTEPPHNHVEAMSPFLPEIENDTLVNILHNGGEIHDHKEDNETTTNPPRLDDDEMHKINPLDLNVTEATFITTPKMEEKKKTDETAITSKGSSLDLLNNIHSNHFFENVDQLYETSTTSNTKEFSASTEDLLAMETTTLDLKTDPPLVQSTAINDIEGTTIVDEMHTIRGALILDNKTTEDHEVTTPKPYEVSESTIDITTEAIILLRKETTTTSINDLEKLQTEDRDEAILRVVPLPKSTDSSKLEKKRQNKDFDANNLNAINDEEQTILDKFKNDNYETTPDTATTFKQATKSVSEFDNVKPVTEGFKVEGFSRCATGQFQCGNGTSLRDGSYCIPKMDRCDSVDDCSDASDEEGCVSNGCPGNFKCASGQCLKRHLVCDGIANCNDDSDETNCGSWSCAFDEYSCGEGQRCIPMSWKCDGRAQCANRLDERNCHPKECANNEFHCLDQDVCIPASWRCDGTSDCSNDDDEKLCGECNNEQFKCATGGGCIDGNLRCDGVAQCADLSDEWKCIRTEKMLQVLSANHSWIPVCGDAWDTFKSDMVCQGMGAAGASATEYIAFNNNSVSNYYRLKPNSSAQHSILAQLEKTDSKCDKVLTISCQEYTCGSHSGIDAQQARIIGGNLAATSQWPSIALLFNKKDNIKCTASLITPKWAITSHSCVELNSNADHWMLIAGGSQFGIDAQNTTQMSQVKTLLIHPQAKYVQFEYKNDAILVELSTPLKLGRNVSVICLPEKTIQERQLCVTAGWGVTKPGDTNMQQYLHYLPVPTIDINECNSTKHYNGRLTSEKICAGYTDSDKSPCYNDEGAPLMCFSESTSTWELQGILSYHANCGRSKHPSIFTAIHSNVKTWILQTIGK